MSSFSFLHAADIHLDSPLRGLEADPEAPAARLRGATREAFRNLVDLALEENVAFVLIAGDLYDGDWQDWRTGHFYVEQAARLSTAGITVITIGGNHDAASVITRQLRLPEGIHHLSSRTPQTVRIDAFETAVHGQSFPRRAVGEDITERYPPPVPGWFNIGLLHTSLTGRPGHDNYAPTDPVALTRLGYDYWALGHVHAREEVSREPWIVFPGNLQGRHARETGPKGASLVGVRDGRVASVEHRPLDVVRWAQVEVPLDGCDALDDASTRVAEALAAALDEAEGRLLAVRVVLSGRTALHGRLLSRAEEARQRVVGEARQFGADRVWIEKVTIATRPATDPERLAERPDTTGRLVRALEAVLADPAILSSDYRDRLRQHLRRIELPDDHPLADPNFPTADDLRAACDLVLQRLDGEA